jgi:hypothetical protein
MKRKTKSRIKKLGLLTIIIIILGIIGTQFFSLYDTDYAKKYDFKDNEVDLRSNDIRVAPKLIPYTGDQLKWSFMKNKVTLFTRYGSISDNALLRGSGGSGFNYKIESTENYYCQELGHKGAFSGVTGSKKVNSYRVSSEGGKLYWLSKSYDLYPRTTIWCYNENEYLPYLKFKTIEPEIMDGYYNTFELKYDVTLNNQEVKSFIIIDNITYYLTDDKKEFDKVFPVNTKVYYGLELITDKTNTPIISKDIKLVPSFTEPKEEEQQGSVVVEEPVVEEPVIIDEGNEEVAQNETQEPISSGGGGGIIKEMQEDDSYDIIMFILVGAILVGGTLLYLKK